MIMKEFPNTRIAQEVSESMETLKKRASEPAPVSVSRSFAIHRAIIARARRCHHRSGACGMLCCDSAGPTRQIRHSHRTAPIPARQSLRRVFERAGDFHR